MLCSIYIEFYLRDVNQQSLQKLQKKLDQKEEQLTNAKKHLTEVEAKLADAANLTPSDLEQLSKEHSSTNNTIQQLPSLAIMDE